MVDFILFRDKLGAKESQAISQECPWGGSFSDGSPKWKGSRGCGGVVGVWGVWWACGCEGRVRCMGARVLRTSSAEE